MIRNLISPSLRFELREAAGWLREQLGRACLWRWDIVRFTPRSDCPYDILYIGRKIHRDTAKALLGVDGDMYSSRAVWNLSSRTAVVSEMPIPGVLRVPWSLRFIVPLGRSINEITAEFESELRRRLRKFSARYRMQQVLDDHDINRAELEMLQPYARARHGISASQIGSGVVRRLAQKNGRLEFVLLEDEVVACQLGCVFTRAGQRYWSSVRFGYPEAVFSDSKRLGEVNSVNFYLALEWALKKGFDHYDMGTCLGRPEDGLLQLKKRWGGVLNTIGNHGYFYVRLPTVGVARFLWDAPLFAIVGNNLSLHLGLPEGPSDEEAAIRYRGMGFGGLYKVFLHCARPPGEQFLEKLRNIYIQQKSPPVLEIISSN